MRPYIVLAFGILAIIACQGLPVKQIEKKQCPSMMQERPQIVTYCNELKSGLPKENPASNLKGTLITTTNSEHEIIQFGRRGEYREYSLRTPVIPDICNYATCGHIPFYQISKIELTYIQVPGNKLKQSRYQVTLKNGKQFLNDGIIWYNNPKYGGNPSTLTSTPATESNDHWFCVIAQEKHFKDPRELCIPENKIKMIIVK